MNKPNIILLTIDTLRSDRLGSYGYSPSITPQIDRLAERGIQFTQAITGGSWTQAAFPVLMTSTYASMHGGCLGPLSASRPSSVNAFKEAGYKTVGFSTSPLLSRNYRYDTGFDEFFDLDPGEKDPGLRNIKGGQLLLKQPFTHYLSNLLRIQTRPAKIYSSAETLTDLVCDWIDKIDGPFFIWAHYMDIHWPYHLENDLVKPQQITQAWRDVDHLHKANWNGDVITSEQRDHYIDLYEKALEYTDAHLGKLFDFIVERGLDDNTIILLVSDHGEEFLEHGRWGHWENNLHDEVLIVPFIIRLPGRDQETVVNRQVRLLDIMPTLHDLCQIPAPEGLLGTSLRPLWSDNPEKYSPEYAISEMWREDWHIVAVRDEKTKLIWDSKRPDSAQFFDLGRDPGEEVNIASESPEKLEKYQLCLEQVLTAMRDTMYEISDAPDIDDDMTRRLRDLGYLE